MAIEDAELRALYAKMLAGLPKTCRRVYVMIREEGTSYREVGRRLGISRSGVYWHMAVARRRFRQGLEKHGVLTVRPHH